MTPAEYIFQHRIYFPAIRKLCSLVSIRVQLLVVNIVLYDIKCLYIIRLSYFLAGQRTLHSYLYFCLIARRDKLANSSPHMQIGLTFYRVSY